MAADDLQNWAAPDGIDDHPRLTRGFPAAVQVCDLDGRITFVTDRWLQLFGFQASEVLGKPAIEFLMPEARALVMASTAEFMRIRHRANMRCRLRHAKGSPVEVTLSSTLEVDGEGTPLRVIDTFHDLTEQAVRDARHKQQQRSLLAHLDAAQAATWEWARETDEIRLNDQWREILGSDADRALPVTLKQWLDRCHPDDAQRLTEALDSHLRGETERFELDARMQHSTDGWIWLRGRGQAQARADGEEPDLVRACFFDVSHQIARNEEARKHISLLDQTGRIASVGGWELAADRLKMTWTRETLRIHGVEDGFQPTAKLAATFYPPEARATIRQAIHDCIETGMPFDHDLPLIRKTGERIWVRVVGQRECRDGKVLRVYGAMQDITQTVHQTNALLAANERVALAAESGRVGTWTLDVVSGQLIWDELMLEHFKGILRTAPDSTRDWIAQLPNEVGRRLKQALRRGMLASQSIDLEMDLETGDGGLRALKIVASPHLDHDGLVESLQGVCLDLTPQRLLNRQLQEQTSRMSVTLSSICEGVITIDPESRILWMNPEAERLTGWDIAEARGRQSSRVLRLLSDGTQQPAPDPLATCLRSGEPVSSDVDIDLVQRDDTRLAIELSVAPILGEARHSAGAVVVFRDVSEQRRQARDIQHRASHDWLTGLLNRAEFETRLSRIMQDETARRQSAFLFVDLDHFKRVNDSLGHSAGDALLRDMRAILTQATAGKAFIGRLGGDEFGILLRAEDRDEAVLVAERICLAISDYCVRADQREIEIRIGASIGIVYLDTGLDTVAEVMRQADIAAYTAKANGRGQAVVWTPGNRSMQLMSRQASLVARLEDTIENNGFEVHAQRIEPIADPALPALRELLARLRDPGGALIPPDDFIPAAERYGLASRLDLRMIEAACRLTKTNAASSSEMLTVNISGASLSSHGFHRELFDLLDAHPVSVVKQLCFEVTETAVVGDMDSASHLLGRLRQRGAQVALDDFGAGASSFRYLGDLPVDLLKIDGYFVDRLSDPIGEASIRCFVHMAKAAGIRTVAERVQSDQQLEQLRALGIDYAQGYHIGHPQPVTAAPDMRSA